VCWCGIRAVNLARQVILGDSELRLLCWDSASTIHAMNSEHGASTRAVGTAAVFLRPLRYMFDVETDVALVCDEESVLPFESVHVHVRAATRPPLMERDELLSGFLRAETTIHTKARHFSSSRGIDKYKLGADCKGELDEDDSRDGERMLSTLRGTCVWLLVRVQPLTKETNQLIPDSNDGKEALRVQYQLSPASESFCLPVDHTNVREEIPALRLPRERLTPCEC